MAEQIPPGRAGRLWLLARLASAGRSLELLDRKCQLLRRELAGLTEARQQRRAQWIASYDDAQRWGLRARTVGSASDVALAAAAVGGRGRADIPWHNTIGVVHPGDPNCSLPTLDPREAAAANAAVAPAAAAYRQALEAAVAHAAIEEAARLLEAELTATERRRRAIEHRRLPALQGALVRLELRLDELEREERVVGRWAKLHQGSPDGTPAGTTDP